MIDRYFDDGTREEEFALFSVLMRSGIRPNDFKFAGVLDICADHVPEELGKPDDALKFFELILKSCTQPDHIIFVGVLSACIHAGLVDKGLEYFQFFFFFWLSVEYFHLIKKKDG